MKLTEKNITALLRPDIHRDGRHKLASILGETTMVAGWPMRLIGRDIDAARYDDILRSLELPRSKGLPRGDCDGQRALF